jgi:hypothetical protein
MAFLTILEIIENYYKEVNEIKEVNQYLVNDLKIKIPKPPLEVPVDPLSVSPIETVQQGRDTPYSPKTELKSMRGQDQMEMEIKRYPRLNGRGRSNSSTVARGSHVGTTD